ncbi:hypothetical protein [Pedobacter nutrimenti]|uniref:hypothetical protein n=1 Tax=Pedobacter nutrimenti TaxID=1241337 RepID=UPI00292FC9DA|nr:hypothetical protein [Pedobacter nutrimenti]
MDSLVKFCVGIVLFIVAYVFYREVRGKKPLRLGDNRFFIEDENRVSATNYYKTWRMVIVCIIGGITFIVYSLES